MKIAQIKDIADAVLYEGYLLYPYRHSALKNRQRWTFGVVNPHTDNPTPETQKPGTMQTECLLVGQSETTVTVYVRFLHLLIHMQQSEENDASWDEGVPREVRGEITLGTLSNGAHHIEMAFPGGEQTIDGAAGTPSAPLRWYPLTGTVTISATPVGPQLFTLRVAIANTSPPASTLPQRRDAPLLQSFVSTHTILQVQHGSFFSLIDPPDELAPLAQSCQNLHTWPVLIGNTGEHDALLSAPIILYDYPQIAPESIGPFFDGTEIDELLALRILTLTDGEKQQMQEADEQTRALLERTEQLSQEQLMKLHGAIRGLTPIDVDERKGETQ